MKFTMRKMAVAIFLAHIASSAYAVDNAPNGGVGTLVDLDVTSGTFVLVDVLTGSSSSGISTFGSIGFDLVDAYGAQAALFQFLGLPLNVFTGDGTITPFGGSSYLVPLTGGPVPSGTATATTIHFDASAFTANFNGNNFNQGNSAVTGTYDSATGVFSASWSVVNVNNPYQGFISTWIVNGVAAAVPEASTYGMMLAGLGLLGGMAARRRTTG